MALPAKRRTKRSLRRTLRIEPLDARILLASDWTNPLNAYDVDLSNSIDTVTPIDALLIINELNNPILSDAEGRLPEIGENDSPPNAFIDVNGDGNASPIDALMVINTLNLDFDSESGGFAFADENVIAGSSAAESADVSVDTVVSAGNNNGQVFPDVDSRSSGESIFAWQSFDSAAGGWNIYAQRFDPTGSKAGDAFLVNSSTIGHQSAAAVAMSENGNFVVAWHSTIGTDDSDHGVYAQEFDNHANPIGDEILVNTTTSGRQWNPDVAYSGSDYTVVWQGKGESDASGIFARTFSAGAGGTESRVNSYANGFQGNPAIDANDSGDITVTWQGEGAVDTYGVYLRELGADRSQTTVVSQAVNTQRIPTIAVSENGNVAVAWLTPDGLSARTYTTGGEQSDVFPITTNPISTVTKPDVAFMANGEVAVAWQESDPNDKSGIYVRTFEPDGIDTSARQLLNRTTLAAHVGPTLAVSDDGYLVSWQGLGNADQDTVFARFVAPLPPNSFSLSEHTANNALVGTLQPPLTLASSDITYEFRNDSQPDALSLAPDDHLSGDTNASVVLIQYTDFQCPTCARYHPIIEQMKQEYSEELLVVTRHLPLATIHDHALETAIFAEAAGQQGKFHEMLDLLFTRQAVWADATNATSLFESYATELGLNLEQVRAAFTDADVLDRISRDFVAATQELNRSSTPTFYINGELVPLSELSDSDVPSPTEFSRRIQTAIDSDNSTISLDRTTGELRVADGSRLDFESNETMSFDVIASDGTNSETITVTINLENLSDETVIPLLPTGAIPASTNTGLRVYDLEHGDGARPSAADTVLVDYVGYLPDGTILDSNTKISFSLSGVIAGFSEGLRGMNVGGTRRMYIPPELGYGPNGNPGAGIGGNDTIVFDVVLREII